jgi:hypothetical protein
MKEEKMSETKKVPEPKRLNDPDMRGAEKAIHRAALQARERARRFGHGIIVYENGRIVEKSPDSDS